MTGIGAVGRFQAAPQGLRRFDASRDLRPVIDLLELGFKDDLEARDRRWLAELASLSKAGSSMVRLLRLLPAPAHSFDGFVCYEDGRLVGNVSLMRASGDVWVIANVVTHPHHRRRGIAARLVEAALDSLEARGARQVQLQVRTGNQPAHQLYAGFGFWQMNSATTLRLPSAHGRSRLSQPRREWRLRPMGARGSWDRGRRLLARAGELDRGGPTSLAVQAMEHHWLWDGLDDWLRGRSRQTWAAEAEGELRALVTVLAPNRHGPHRIDLVVDPRWQGRVEAPLLDIALHSLSRLEPFEVEAEIDSRRRSVLEAMTEAGFREIRTLDRLAYDFERC